MPAERVIKYESINRRQLLMTALDIETLIPGDHIARVIWALTEKLDLSSFEINIQSFEGEGGRPVWPPQLLISVLVYGYTLGIASARALERMMSWEPGLRWLYG